jgi:hypothetical protein
MKNFVILSAVRSNLGAQQQFKNKIKKLNSGKSKIYRLKKLRFKNKISPNAQNSSSIFPIGK